MSDGSLISSCTLALARRFSTTLRRNLQAPRPTILLVVAPTTNSSFPSFLFLSPSSTLTTLDNRSLSFRVHRSHLRLLPTNRHPYVAISGVMTRGTQQDESLRDWRSCEVSTRVQIFEERRF